MRKKPPSLAINISLVNNGYDSPFKGESPMGNTYREEGLSIGRDYMRFEGSTLSSELSPSALRIEGTIGRGSCSIVKKARLLGTAEPLALKIFPIRDIVTREMLVKELRALCSVECDCLVSLVGAFFDVQEKTITMVLEYMDKGTLVDMMKGRSPRKATSSPRKTMPLTSIYGTPRTQSNDEIGSFRGSPTKAKGLPERAVASIGFQMLWGLGYLHHENMLHRDIKPANVLVNSDGKVKLADFGISSKREIGQVMNLTVIGTTRYMSPERLRAKPYGTPSDMWSLGLVLLECATGRSPFDGITSVVELVQTIEESTLDQLVPSTLSDGLREMLKACLRLSPEKRIPAKILITSPWFSLHGIENIDDAAHLMREHFNDTAASPSSYSTAEE